MVVIRGALNISESTMLKTFKKVYFISPKQYLDQLRYNESKYLLSQPSLPISNISEIVGYQNVSHFSRQFKSRSHLSPREYRQKIDKN
ncbi:MAG: helix-turn-helix domain-containing protein [Pseudolactococcus laudensis]